MTDQELLAEYKGLIERIATIMRRSYKLNRFDVQDMIADCNLALLSLPHDFRRDTPIYVRRVIANAASRRVKRDILPYRDSILPNDSANIQSLIERMPDHSNDIEQIEKCHMVSQLLAGCTELQQSILTLYFGLGGNDPITDPGRIATLVGLRPRQERQVQREIDCAMARMRRMAGAPQTTEENLKADYRESSKLAAKRSK